MIRMLHTFIGDEAFRKGMNAYLTKHAYSNAGTLDLWTALEQASGEKVTAIMSTWTTQLGYPVLKVTELKEGDSGSKRVFRLEQSKFSLEPADEFAHLLWQIPTRVISASSLVTPVAKLLLSQRDQVVEIDGVNPNDWLMVCLN